MKRKTPNETCRWLLGVLDPLLQELNQATIVASLLGTLHKPCSLNGSATTIELQATSPMIPMLSPFCNNCATTHNMVVIDLQFILIAPRWKKGCHLKSMSENVQLSRRQKQKSLINGAFHRLQSSNSSLGCVYTS